MEHGNPADTAEAGLRQLDGYLYWQAEHDTARHEAAALCDRLPWLTTAEREDLEREYTRTRAEASRTMTRRVAVRCVELREEYEARYRLLRRRVVAAATGVVGGVCALVELWRGMR
ncbi:hypothetical protein I5Q34_00695 [Streptomyces sp. AV19]|uniref:hypothetical protein n=1 Tax=Streptomyces sp. AV19 TaxID=2793068 RepID=UPI0018FE6211|nr:hypothetical protein [Streptomyces sp. AV19]MBH1932826.1 hypothetical protein [Streptomyces sp. AV19]MDG4531491.1 hypothetical protein [Streptomyces sp. AV19]